MHKCISCVHYVANTGGWGILHLLIQGPMLTKVILNIAGRCGRSEEQRVGWNILTAV